MEARRQRDRHMFLSRYVRKERRFREDYELWSYEDMKFDGMKIHFYFYWHIIMKYRLV
jgi:hypothetical protein